MRNNLKHLEIDFIASPDDLQVERIRQTHNLAVIPSREEGFGLPVAEAIFNDQFPIYSDIAIFNELYDFLNVGRKFSANDSADLAKAIKYVLADENLDTKASQELKASIFSHYSWRRAAQDSLEILNS